MNDKDKDDEIIERLMERVLKVRLTDTGLRQEQLKSISESKGFANQKVESPTERGPRRKRGNGPSKAVTVMIPLRVYEPFLQFCEEHSLSYWRGIEELLNRAGYSVSRW